MEPQYDVYRKLMQLMMHAKREMAEIMEQRQMTPVQGMLLMLFEPGESKSMQELSRHMACDASNTTGLIDRLDSQGLIERTSDPKDRRLKMITLSQKGLDCREQILKALRKAEAADLQQLTPEEQSAFVQIVSKLTD